MSGHSKWATIRRKKGAIDAKRGKIFTKLIREIATAARIGGGDPNANPRLRLAVDKARGANMPKDNIERAIKKGIGAGEGESYESIVYEGYGPGGTALYVETLTDNKNRTVGEVRHALSKHGGNLGAAGCVSYLFERRGVVSFDRAGIDSDALLEAALDAGAADVIEAGDSVDVVTQPGDFESVKQQLEARGFRPASAQLGMEPSTMVTLQGKDAEQIVALIDALEDLDDVQNVFSNFDVSEADLSRLAN